MRPPPPVPSASTLVPSWRLVVVGVAAALVLAAPPACTCQRAENIEAKARLSTPAPPDPSVKAADDAIDVDALTDANVMRRVVRMEGQEIAARLRSFVMTSSGELTFGRAGDGAEVRSSESTRMVQGLPRADGSSGDFSIDLVTGDGSEMRLAYVNEVFFLKNNNGRWRLSRDPQGERNGYRSDALGVWRSFYDLVSHALVVERVGAQTAGGRPVVKYRLSLPDRSAEARLAGAQLAPAPTSVPGPDGGTVDEPPEQKRARVRERMSKWRQRAVPAGGAGELVVDEATGVVTGVTFAGAMVVGDGPDPSRLEVKIAFSISEVGKNHELSPPKDAIEEVTRTKMPARPRALLEEADIVAPLVDAGPGGASNKRAAGSEGPPDNEDDAP